MKREPFGVPVADRWWVNVMDPSGLSSMVSCVSEDTARVFVAALLDEIMARAPVDGLAGKPWMIRANLTGAMS